MSIMKTLQTGDRLTSLAQAMAEIGRADKTIHMLTYLNDENKRRRTLQQLNRGEGLHAVARNVFHGKRGELRQAYREGQEDQLGSLGLVFNIIVLWNPFIHRPNISHHRAITRYKGSCAHSNMQSGMIYSSWLLWVRFLRTTDVSLRSPVSGISGDFRRCVLFMFIPSVLFQIQQYTCDYRGKKHTPEENIIIV